MGGVTEPLLGEEETDRQKWEGGISSSLSNRSSQHAASIKVEKVGADRGTGLYQLEREKLGLPSLVQGGRHAGRSRVLYRGHHLSFNLLFSDFFITSIQQKTWVVVAVAAASYMLMYWIWGILYWLIVRFHPGCIYGASTFVEAWVFAVITHTTVGYGNTGPQQCWAASWMISVQTIIAILQNAVVVGVVFARISHPKQRGRSIYVSEVAVIARRDGILKFMFRIADVRKTQVVQPSVRAYLYTWGEGRVTAEGESIQVRCEQLHIGYIDGQLLLPLIIEHSIDERSPLCGHTHDSLMALNAEIVVIFEGTTEFGNPFMVRRSYLPTEIAWGHKFKEVIQRPFAAGETRFMVNLQQFHEIERQPELPPLAPSELSQLVVSRAKRSVPYPLLGDNTLVLSDVLCLAPNKRGQLCLTCRVADTYPNQMVDLTVRMYLYRWTPAEDVDDDPQEPAFSQHLLECGFRDGADRLYLRLPMEVNHVIDDSSPLASWRDAEGLQADERSEIVVVVSGSILLESQNRVRQRTYVVGHHVRPGFRFVPIVKHPALTRDHKPRVRWGQFHEVAPATTMYLWPAVSGGGSPPQAGQGSLGRVSGSELAQAEAFLERRGLSQAPESHAVARTLEDRGAMRRPSRAVRALPSISEHSEVVRAAGTVPLGAVQRYGSSPGGSSRAGRGPWRQRVGTGLAVLHPYEEQADFTVTALDLQRYAATMGPGGDATLMPGMMGHPQRAPLPSPSFFSESSPQQQGQEQEQEQEGGLRQGQRQQVDVDSRERLERGQGALGKQQQQRAKVVEAGGVTGLEEEEGEGSSPQQQRQSADKGGPRVGAAGASQAAVDEGSVGLGRGYSGAVSGSGIVPGWGSRALGSSGAYGSGGWGEGETEGEDAESRIWQQGDFVVGSTGSGAFGPMGGGADSPEEEQQHSTFTFQRHHDQWEQQAAPSRQRSRMQREDEAGGSGTQGALERGSSQGRRLEQPSESAVEGAGGRRDVGEWLETLPSSMSELRDEYGEEEGGELRRPSSQQTSPISVPRHRISKMEPFTAGFATVDELGEEVEGDDDDTQSGSEGRQQANHSPPASPDRPEKGRRRATFAVPEHQHPVQEGDRPQHSLGHEIEQGLYGEERVGSADLSDEGGTTAGSNNKLSLPISFRSESWKRGRSLANLFKLGTGSQDELMQLKESLQRGEGLLSTGSSSGDEEEHGQNEDRME